jgi:integrase
LQALTQAGHGTAAQPELQPFRNHDIRRTGRTTLSRLGVDTETAEAVLAHRHAAGAIAATYDVWERFPEKRAALEKWANFLAGLMRPKLAQAGHWGIG